MTGIPVHTSSPINPHAPVKASGTTPTTTAAQQATSMPAATTTAAFASYPQAQPGASAMPQPTGSLRNSSETQPTPTRTSALAASSTTLEPPAPQPGAIPSPYTTNSQSDFSTPPKPQPGSMPQDQPRTGQLTQIHPPAPLQPHQQSPALYSSNRAQPPASTTSTFNPQDLSHPPGYVQNSRASFEDNTIDAYRPFGNMSNTTSQRTGGGILDGHSNNEHQALQEEKGMWDTAMGWAKVAGQKLQEGEEQIWKTINREN